MAFTETDRQAMNNAAIDAENDLVDIIDDKYFTIVADWWTKWYPTAGHKRLARILLQYKTKEER